MLIVFGTCYAWCLSCVELCMHGIPIKPHLMWGPRISHLACTDSFGHVSRLGHAIHFTCKSHFTPHLRSQVPTWSLSWALLKTLSMPPSDGPIVTSGSYEHIWYLSGGHWPTLVSEVRWGRASACGAHGHALSCYAMLHPWELHVRRCSGRLFCMLWSAKPHHSSWPCKSFVRIDLPHCGWSMCQHGPSVVLARTPFEKFHCTGYLMVSSWPVGHMSMRVNTPVIVCWHWSLRSIWVLSHMGLGAQVLTAAFHFAMFKLWESHCMYYSLQQCHMY